MTPTLSGNPVFERHGNSSISLTIEQLCSHSPLYDLPFVLLPSRWRPPPLAGTTAQGQLCVFNTSITAQFPNSGIGSIRGPVCYINLSEDELIRAFY